MNILSVFRPKLIDCMREGYSRKLFLGDLSAGITVGIVALPLAMAFAIASGATPQAGLVTAIIAGFIISLLGGSKVQIGGPTGAFVIIVAGIIAQYGYGSLLICTFMAGIMLVLMGLARFGSVIKYIPYPVTIGFTNGIALLIMLTQVRDALGLDIDKVPADFFQKITSYATHLGSINPAATAITVASLGLLILWPRLKIKIPASIVVVLLSTLAVTLFHIPVETIGSRFGELPRSIPMPTFPAFSFETFKGLITPAMTIAMLGAIESLLSAVVADGMIEERHNSNTELIGQGIANIFSPLFGGLPATGALARTATNVRSGAKTPLAGMIHAITLLVILLVAAPWAKYIPLAGLAAILLNVGFRMGEWHDFKMLRRYPLSDSLVLLATFLLTVIIDLTVAIQVGMMLAAVLFIRRVSETTNVDIVSQETECEGAEHSITGKDVPQGVHLYRVFGPMFFGAADKLETVFTRSNQMPEVLILRLRKVPSIDATALNALISLKEKLAFRGCKMILSGVQPQPLATLKRSGAINKFAADEVCENIDMALAHARAYLEEKKQAAEHAHQA
ncbi:MAG: STAS domain-containing protein [Opitutales bacterium]|nr:STAS domain-containing protein [Opitutales bacterium]